MSEPTEQHVTDGLRNLGSEHSPPPGWDTRVLSATEPPQRRRIALAVLAVIIAVVSLIWLLWPRATNVRYEPSSSYGSNGWDPPK